MIELKNCMKKYKKGKVGIENVNICLPKNGFIGIYGKSGSGKSTLINCLGGLDKFTSGEIYLDNVLVKNLSNYCSYVFQEYKLVENLSIIENLELSCSKCDLEYIDELLKKLDLVDFKKQKVNLLSGGQRQRVELIRAIIQNSNIILCDEPIANVDDETAEAILKLLKEISKDKLVVVVSHNVNLLNRFTTNLIEIEDGSIKSNSLDPDSSICNYTKNPKNKLKTKFALKISCNNIKRSKVRFIMTFVFMFLSFILLGLILTILSLKLPELQYKAYSYEKSTVSFYDNDRYVYEDAFSQEQYEKLNPEYIVYSGFSLALCQENGKFLSFNYLIKVNEQTALELNLDDSHIYVSKKIYEKLDTKKLFYFDYTFEVSNYFELNDYEGYIIVNEHVYDILKTNNLGSIRSVYLNINDEIQSFQIFNNNVEKYDVQIPQADNEVVLTTNFVKKLNLEPTEVIGQTINLKFANEVDLDNKNNDGTVSFKVIGVGVYFVFTKDVFNKICNSCNCSDQFTSLYSARMGFINYDLNDFKTAYNQGLEVVEELGHNMNTVFKMFNNLLPFLYAFLVIFILISFFTIINNTTSSINQNKKLIGVLTSFNIKQSSIPKIYIFENFIIAIITWIIAVILYWPVLASINAYLKVEYSIGFECISGRVYILILLLVFMALIILIALIIPLKRLLFKKKIDLLTERA